MLAQAGIAHDVVDSGIDDALLEPGSAGPIAWVTALAYLKARAALDQARPGDAVIGADTVCVMDGRIIGQPRDDADAAAMIVSFVDREHDVVTGVCVLQPDAGDTFRRGMRHDRARVRFGSLPAREISRYVASGEWRGKAGGYNFTQRRAAGWPLEVEGDADTVVGLPMRLLQAMLDAPGVDVAPLAGART